MASKNFTETIFLKRESNLQKQLEALEKLRKEYPNNKKIEEELYTIKKGIDGEKEIEYQLSKANIGMYVLHDVNFEYKDLKAQVDYIVVTKAFCYFIECKNLIGNITINDKGDFIREYTINGKTTKKGMYSPLRQVEAQRDVYKKICDDSWSNSLVDRAKKTIADKYYKTTHKTLVVVANHETILKMMYAPKDIQNKVVRADALVRKIEQDIEESDKSLWYNQKETWEWANIIKKRTISVNYDYYKIFKDKFVNEDNAEAGRDDLRKRLKEFRTARAKEKSIPPYYVFNNDELEKLIELKPKTRQELENANILPKIKILAHGDLIIEIINN